MKPDWKDVPSKYQWIWLGSSGGWLGGVKKPSWDFISGSWSPPENCKWGWLCETELNEWNRSILKKSIERRP